MLSLQERMRGLPRQPGVYLFTDEKGGVLYVGKARSLKSRVSQYRLPTRLDPSKRELMAETADVETIVTKNETEALALEASLIQRHAPPYNVRLVDNPYYLYVKITRETYPAVKLVRRVETDGAWYRGPFPDTRAVRRTLREARKLFPWCDYPAVGPKPCFAYHLGLCPGVCAWKISLEEYQRSIDGLKRFLDGDTDEALRGLRVRMAEASRREEYERAAKLRDAITAIERATAPQHVVTPRTESVDALGIARTGARAAITVLAVRLGRVVGIRTFSLVAPGETTPADVLRGFLLSYLPRAADGAKKILLPEPVEDAQLLTRLLGAPRVVTPKRGWRRRLLELARMNAAEGLQRQTTELESPAALLDALAELQKALGLDRPPRRIEAYDVSNIQGVLGTGSMVVFADGKPKRTEYRKFKIRTLGTPNDVAMMKEVLRRRFERHAPQGRGKRAEGRVVRRQARDTRPSALSPKSSEWPLPDLILLDGGKPQLGAGLSVLRELGLELPIAALAKREEELFVPAQSESGEDGTRGKSEKIPRSHALTLPRSSPALFLLQRLRDEAHRFTSWYHQLLRKKRQTRSILEEIPGVGDATRKKLLRAFGSLRAISEAPAEELARAVGPKLAGTIRRYLQDLGARSRC